MQVAQRLGALLVELRQSADLSQETVAAAAGITRRPGQSADPEDTIMAGDETSRLHPGTPSVGPSRGFRVRREEIGQLIVATRGKVFTLHDLIPNTRLSEFVPALPRESADRSRIDDHSFCRCRS